MSEAEPFLKRWSRLKREPRQDVKGKSSETASVPQETPVSSEKDKENDEKLVRELPPIETLTKDSDFSVFMRKGVPEGLRLQALRKLWASDPVLAGPDPLDFQNVDFTHLVTDEIVQTSYQVGRGFADRIDEAAQGREPEARSQAGAAIEPASTETPAATVPPGNGNETEAEVEERKLRDPAKPVAG